MDLVLQTAARAFKEIFFEERNSKDFIGEALKNRAVIRYQDDIKLLASENFKHGILVHRVFKNDFDKLTIDEICLLSICFVNNHITKQFDDEKVIIYLRRKLGKKYQLVEHGFVNFNLDKYLASIIDELEMLSVKYNIPYWIIKLLSKQKLDYPLEELIIALREKKPDIYFSLKNLKRDSSYVELDDNIYKSIESVKKDPEVLLINRYFTDVINDLVTSDYRSIYVYLDKNINFLQFFLENYINPLTYYYVGINHNVNQYTVNSVFNNKFIKSYKTFTYNNEASLKTAFSTKVDLAIIYPYSTSFNRASEILYIVRMKQSTLDVYIKRQRHLLETTSRYINDGGSLVYINDTLDKKENTMVVNDFLSRHSEYELVKEKQYYPFDDYNCGYYALLRKKK